MDKQDATTSEVEEPIAQEPAASTEALTEEIPTVPLTATDQAPAGAQTTLPPAAGTLSTENMDPDTLMALNNLEARRKQRRRKKGIKIGVVCGIVGLLVLGWALSGVIRNMMPQDQSESEIATAERGTLTSSVQASGTLKPGAQVAVAPEVSGIIQDVRVTEGQHVEAGDVLLTIKSTDIERSLADAQATLDRAHRELSEAQAGVASAWDSYNEAVDEYNDSVDEADEAKAQAKKDAKAAYDETYKAEIDLIPELATKAERKELVAAAKKEAKEAYDAVISASGAFDPGEFDDSLYLEGVKSAEDGVTLAQDGVEDAQRAYDSVAEEADKRIVKAMAAGTVLDLKATPGAAVGFASGGLAQANDTLARIADLSALTVDVEVNEVDISSIAVGQPAMLTFPAVPGLQLDGKVTSVASVASGTDDETGAASGLGGIVTFKVTVVADPDERLKPGMSANVDIQTKGVPGALLVPIGALVEEFDATYVNVVTSENPLETEKREVVVSDRTSTDAAITSGLQEGDRVLVNSNSNDGSGAGSSSSSGAR